MKNDKSNVKILKQQLDKVFCWDCKKELQIVQQDQLTHHECGSYYTKIKLNNCAFCGSTNIEQAEGNKPTFHWKYDDCNPKWKTNGTKHS